MGVKDIVTSPTFVIINEYEGRYPFYHVDTYRLTSSEDLRGIGYEEYFYSDGVTVVEWGQKIEDLMDWLDQLRGEAIKVSRALLDS